MGVDGKDWGGLAGSTTGGSKARRDLRTEWDDRVQLMMEMY